MTAVGSNSHILAVEGVTVSFDGFKAITDLSLYVDKNEIRALIGPNGAGKTTLLDLITGKTRPTSGKVSFKNEELTGLPEYKIARKGVGRKFQTPSVHEALTVFENLELAYPAARGWFKSWTFRRTPALVQRVEEVAELIFLKERLSDLAGELSHGQKQWLEIGSLLIQDPELMMLDEPVAGMSIHEREQTAELLNVLCKSRAVIVVEHDMEFVKRIAHKVTVLHQGKWLAEGSMESVQNNEKVIEVYLGH
ncbi:MAG: Branched-chain amino acid transporter ATP-binding protein [Myxococcaceae bacterium]|nr:Branched-chain amino acid transporter ATP-binding protein [Myxococcaceae bacterium]